MNAEQVMTELKKYRLATFGTAHERKERLRKHHGKFTSGTISRLMRLTFDIGVSG